MPIQIRQLEAFRAVAQCGSMTQAAAELEISQPAVSRLLANFTESVGFQLFERKGRQLMPTQESRLLLQEVGRLLDSVNHIDELVHNLTNRKAGHLRIACLPGFATSHMPGVLSRFLADKPAVTVTLEPDRPEHILEWMIHEQYDCGITDGLIQHPAVESEQIAMRTVCILPEGHPLSEKQWIGPEDLRDEPMVHTRRDSSFFRELSAVFAAANVPLNSWIETRQFTAACMIVAEGKGVSVVSEMDAAGHINRGVEMRPFLPAVPHTLSLLRPTHTLSSMLTLEFMEYFSQSLQAYRCA